MTSIVIPTCDRPAALERCVSTLLSNLAVYGRSPRILIADGSVTRNAPVDNRDVAASLNKGYPASVALIGHDEGGHLIGELVSAGLDEGVVKFALGGIPDLRIGCFGANRNFLLLMTSGENFVSVDDDTEMSFASGSQFRRGSAAEDSVKHEDLDPFLQVRVYHDRQSLQQSVEFGPLDFIGAHESILGARVAEFCPPFGEPAIAARTTDSPAESGRVVLTFSGLAGDCGWGTPSQYLFLSQKSLEGLTSSDEMYLESITSRDLAQLTTALTLSQRTDYLMATAFAADNRSMLPPFIPVGRGEDSVFGRVVQNTQHDVWFGHLPHAIFHGPVGRRRFARGEIIRSAATTDLASLMCATVEQAMVKQDVVEQAPIRGGDIPGSLRELGRSLSAFGAMSINAFQEYIRECRTRLSQRRLAFLEGRLGSAGGLAPSYVADLKTYIARLREGDRREDAGIPAEILYGREIGDALYWTRKVIATYGELLSAWPDIVEVAQGCSPRLVEESHV